MSYKKIKTKFNTGFTLVETLIAITVLMTGVVLPMSIYSRSISSARSSGNQITAYYLAQDALEYIKFKVNTELNNNIPSGKNYWFKNGLPSCETGGGLGKCVVDSHNKTITTCGSGCSLLYFDSSIGVYDHDTNTGLPSIFSRVVRFKQNPDKKGAPVEVVVSWMDGSVPKKVVVKEYMFKWR